MVSVVERVLLAVIAFSFTEDISSASSSADFGLWFLAFVLCLRPWRISRFDGGGGLLHAVLFMPGILDRPFKNDECPFRDLPCGDSGQFAGGPVPVGYAVAVRKGGRGAVWIPAHGDAGGDCEFRACAADPCFVEGGRVCRAANDECYVLGIIYLIPCVISSLFIRI